MVRQQALVKLQTETHISRAYPVHAQSIEIGRVGTASPC